MFKLRISYFSFEYPYLQLRISWITANMSYEYIDVENGCPVWRFLALKHAGGMGISRNRIITALCSRLNTLRPRQNGRRFADDTFKRIFLNENVRISIKISLKFVPKGPINNNPALVQIMAWRRSGDKPLTEPMMVSLLTHICVTRPQWVTIKYPC